MLNSSVVEPPLLRVASGAALLELYDAYFCSQKADTCERVNQAFALRYQVYCLERQFEDPAQHLSQLETDKFDSQAVHGLVVHRATAEAVGTARLILPQQDAGHLPILSILRDANIDPETFFPVSQTAEISRFAITRQFGRRAYEQSDSSSARNSNLPCLGLVQILLRLSIECGVTHWAAVMEPKLMRMFAIMGIHFSSIGSLVSYHGIRQPCVCHVPRMLETLLYEKPEHWNVVTNGGNLTYAQPNTASRTAA